MSKWDQNYQPDWRRALVIRPGPAYLRVLDKEFDMGRFATTRALAAEQWRQDGRPIEAISRIAPDETPIGLVYNGRPHAVVMATPADLEDLAVGFTITESIAELTDIEDVQVEERDEGMAVFVTLKPAAEQSLTLARKRSLEGRSSCGLCGVTKLSDMVRSLRSAEAGLTVSRGAIQRALQALEGAQVLGKETRATHAAAWCTPSGELLLVREDVGRHCALDKVIGAALTDGLDPADAFIVVTSRCSYEMVEKTAMAGVGLLVAISAPTALAIRKAEEAGLTLVALARADGHTVFTRPERIVDEVEA
jgi:FdhD protein